MYEGLRLAIKKVVANPEVIELGSAVVYKGEGGFSYAPYTPADYLSGVAH
jgi:hypothetical protein